jgi:hypothetical protein
MSFQPLQPYWLVQNEGRNFLNVEGEENVETLETMPSSSLLEKGHRGVYSKTFNYGNTG